MSGRYETDRLELGSRVAVALAQAGMLMDSLLNPAQADGLACVYCNRPADDGPMVPLTALPSLFRCADEMGCLPEPLNGTPRCPECGAEFRHQVPTRCPLCGTPLYIEPRITELGWRTKPEDMTDAEWAAFKARHGR